MKLTELCHKLLRDKIEKGQIVVDATVGNGKDTIFLAQCLNNTGKIIGFDIQDIAIEKTYKALEKEGFSNVKLFCKSHTELEKIFREENLQYADMVVFNLGYLPGGDHALTTTASETISALNQSAKLLKVNGILSLMIYPGHPEGQKEAEEIEKWLPTVEGNLFKIERYTAETAKPRAPYLLICTKLA